MFEERLFYPYTKDGFSLGMIIKLIKKNVDIEDRILVEIVKDATQMIQQGERFLLPCPCGCGEAGIHVPLMHFMLEKSCDLKNKTEKAILEVLLENQRERAAMKAGPPYEKAKGNWAQRSLSPLKRMLRIE